MMKEQYTTVVVTTVDELRFLIGEAIATALKPVVKPKSAIQLLSLKEAANIVGCCDRTITRKVKAGQLKKYGHSGIHRYLKADILALFNIKIE